MREMAGSCGLSVLVATKRPEMIAFWPQLLAAQDYPDFEVIAALHGDAFTAADVATARAWLGERLTVLRVPGECVLGDVLNRALAAAGGELIVKWDDDDLYSSRHLSDLATGHRESGAIVVGKSLEYFYLAARQVTIRLMPFPLGLQQAPAGGALRVQQETLGVYAGVVAANSLCVARHDLQRLGGWEEIPVAPHSRLIRNVMRQDGRIYRTAGAGHLVMRTLRPGHHHTWSIEDAELLGFRAEQRPGADAGFAMVDVPEALLERWAGVREFAV